MNLEKFIIGIAIWIVSTSSSIAATIDFDAVVYGDPYLAGSVITNQYDGVTFSLLSDSLNPGYPGPVLDSFGTLATSGLFNTFNENSAIVADFDIALSSATFSSIADTALSVYAYDDLGNSIGAKIDIFGLEEGIIGSASNNIFRLVFINESGTGYAGQNFTAISSLTYNSITPVPVPPALFLFLSGILSLVGFNIRHKKA
ncbi:MAG: hypothetical protein OEY67_04095 [Gammaproteobacteria bacterium]|nr:hypothetical protein [Gammaproteobacteria bacterium]